MPKPKLEDSLTDITFPKRVPPKLVVQFGRLSYFIHLRFISCLLSGVAVIFSLSVRAQTLDVFDYIEPASVVKTYLYSSTSTSNLPGMQGWEYSGQLIHTHSKFTNDNDGRLLTVNTETRGLEEFPTNYETEYLQTLDGYYSITVNEAGERVQNLILPINLKPGRSWLGSSFWDSDTLDSIVDYSSAAGAFKACLKIIRANMDRTDLSQKVGERQQEVAILCPQVGLVSSTVTNIINAVQFKTVTTIELQSMTDIAK